MAIVAIILVRKDIKTMCFLTKFNTTNMFHVSCFIVFYVQPYFMKDVMLA